VENEKGEDEGVEEDKDKDAEGREVLNEKGGERGGDIARSTGHGASTLEASENGAGASEDEEETDEETGEEDDDDAKSTPNCI
jgi:hypothetical protein